MIGKVSAINIYICLYIQYTYIYIHIIHIYIYVFRYLGPFEWRRSPPPRPAAAAHDPRPKALSQASVQGLRAYGGLEFRTLIEDMKFNRDPSVT